MMFAALCMLSAVLTLLAVPGIILAYREAVDRDNPYAPRPGREPKPHANRCPVAREIPRRECAMEDG